MIEKCPVHRFFESFLRFWKFLSTLKSPDYRLAEHFSNMCEKPFEDISNERTVRCSSVLIPTLAGGLGEDKEPYASICGKLFFWIDFLFFQL